MFRYCEDKVYLSSVRNLCGDIMQDLCHTLKKRYDIGATFYLVGSGARNLITQNENGPVDLDYNLKIVRCDDFRDCNYLKETVRKAFNIVLRQYGWGDCADSTSALTTKQRVLKKGNNTPFSIDVCIVREDDIGNLYRLIHQKTGIMWNDQYFWNQVKNSKDIRHKVDFIKKSGSWNKVREGYLNKKNYYLKQNYHNHPSFICYIEAVNNVYNSLNSYWKVFTPMSQF